MKYFQNLTMASTKVKLEISIVRMKKAGDDQWQVISKISESNIYNRYKNEVYMKDTLSL